MSDAGRRLLVILPVAALVNALSGCSSLAEPARTQIVRVEIEVPVPCRVAAIQKPEFWLDRVDPAADIHTKGKRALAEIEQRRAYEVQLEAAVAACQ